MDDYENPLPGKAYFSPALPSFWDKARDVRIATKVYPSANGLEYAKERGEVVLRSKPDAATCIRAKFLEDSRQLFVLTIQKFSNETGQPYGAGFSFVGDEIGNLKRFLDQIEQLSFPNRSSIAVTDEQLHRMTVTSEQATKLVAENEGIFAEVVRHKLTKQDVTAIGYRKIQLGVFERLLNDPEYFKSLKQRKKCKDEQLWQRFFEKNPWIFGYGLNFIYTAGLDEQNLETVVRGHCVANSGKRVDALLKTKALASTLCFVEIKTHETPLLGPKAYRASCWPPSKDLAGATAQIQGTVSFAMESLQGELRTTDDAGFPTDEVMYNFHPRSFVVIGTTGQFIGSHGINQDQLRSFELYRQNMTSPEIITFDELFERARHIVNSSDVGHESA